MCSRTRYLGAEIPYKNFPVVIVVWHNKAGDATADPDSRDFCSLRKMCVAKLSYFVTQLVNKTFHSDTACLYYYISETPFGPKKLKGLVDKALEHKH